jgi:hypothetical protein
MLEKPRAFLALLQLLSTDPGGQEAQKALRDEINMLQKLIHLNRELKTMIQEERETFLLLMPGLKADRFQEYNRGSAIHILWIQSDARKKMKEVVPALNIEVFDDFEKLQREFDQIYERLT